MDMDYYCSIDDIDYLQQGSCKFQKTLENIYDKDPYFSYSNRSTDINTDESENNFNKSYNNVFNSSNKNDYFHDNTDDNSFNDKVLFITPKEPVSIKETTKIFVTEKKTKESKKVKTKKIQKKETAIKGRRKKNEPPSSKVKHDKFSKDNIVQRIKRLFVIRCFELINKKYKEYITKNNQGYQPLLKRISQDAYNVFSKDKNQRFLALNLGELFSSELSNRYSNFLRKNSKDYNKKRIDWLKKENKAIEVIDILNTIVRDMYEKYIKNEIDEFNLENDIAKIEDEEKNGIKYKDLFKETAKNLIDILNRKGKYICKNRH